MNKTSVALLIIAISLTAARDCFPAQVYAAFRPFEDNAPRYGVDVYPLAVTWIRQDDIAFWSGPAAGIAFDRDSRYVSLSYGLAYFAFTSGGVFAGAVFDATHREAGAMLKITQAVFAVPFSITFQRTGAAPRGMLFEVSLSAGIGALMPILRREDNQFRWFFER